MPRWGWKWPSKASSWNAGVYEQAAPKPSCPAVGTRSRICLRPRIDWEAPTYARLRGAVDRLACLVSRDAVLLGEKRGASLHRRRCGRARLSSAIDSSSNATTQARLESPLNGAQAPAGQRSLATRTPSSAAPAPRPAPAAGRQSVAWWSHAEVALCRLSRVRCARSRSVASALSAKVESS